MFVCELATYVYQWRQGSGHIRQMGTAYYILQWYLQSSSRCPITNGCLSCPHAVPKALQSHHDLHSTIGLVLMLMHPNYWHPETIQVTMTQWAH